MPVAFKCTKYTKYTTSNLVIKISSTKLDFLDPLQKLKGSFYNILGYLIYLRTSRPLAWAVHLMSKIETLKGHLSRKQKQGKLSKI